MSVALLPACGPPIRKPPPVPPPLPVSTPVAAPTTSEAPVVPTHPVPTEPPKPPAPRVSADEAREATARESLRLLPVLPAGARLGALQATPNCTQNACVWTSQVLVDVDTVLGTLDVDAETGAVTYEPNDGTGTGTGGRFGIDAFLQREAERERAVKAVASLPIVQTYCKKIRAMHLGCLIYFEEGPSEEGCASSPPLASSCWNQVYVGEAHETHASRFATFLVNPATSAVVGASGYCGPVPIKQFRGPGSDCPK